MSPDAAHRLVVFSSRSGAALEQWRAAWLAVAPHAEAAIRAAELHPDVASLDATLGALPITWMPAEPPGSVGDAAWQALRLRGHTHRRRTRALFAARSAFGADYATELGRLDTPLYGVEAGRLVRSFRGADVVALVADVDLHFDLDRYDTVRVPRPGANGPHGPLALGSAAALGEEPPRDDLTKVDWDAMVDMIQFVGFALEEPGIIIAGVMHLLSALIGPGLEHPISIQQSVADELNEADIQAAIRDISLIGTSYAGFVNGALSEARDGALQSQTHWVSALNGFFKEQGLPSGPLGIQIDLLHDKIIDILGRSSPDRQEVLQLQHALTGLGLGLAVYSNILLALHHRDLVLLMLDIEKLEAAGAKPWSLPEDEQLHMVKQKTAWLDEFLVPQLQRWGIDLLEKYVTPRLEVWWRDRADRVSVVTYQATGNRYHRIPQQQAVHEAGHAAYAVHAATPFSMETNQPDIGGCGGSKYATHPRVQAELDKYMAGVRAHFLREVFGPKFHESYLVRMAAAWKQTIASVATMTAQIAEDQAARIQAWRERARAAGRDPKALLSNVSISRAKRPGGA